MNHYIITYTYPANIVVKDDNGNGHRRVMLKVGTIKVWGPTMKEAIEICPVKEDNSNRFISVTKL
jgi:hypothetical protein